MIFLINLSYASDFLESVPVNITTPCCGTWQNFLCAGPANGMDFYVLPKGEAEHEYNLPHGWLPKSDFVFTVYKKTKSYKKLGLNIKLKPEYDGLSVMCSSIIFNPIQIQRASAYILLQPGIGSADNVQFSPDIMQAVWLHPSQVFGVDPEPEDFRYDVEIKDLFLQKIIAQSIQQKGRYFKAQETAEINFQSGGAEGSGTHSGSSEGSGTGRFLEGNTQLLMPFPRVVPCRRYSAKITPYLPHEGYQGPSVTKVVKSSGDYYSIEGIQLSYGEDTITARIRLQHPDQSNACIQQLEVDYEVGTYRLNTYELADQIAENEGVVELTFRPKEGQNQYEITAYILDEAGTAKQIKIAEAHFPRTEIDSSGATSSIESMIMATSVLTVVGIAPSSSIEKSTALLPEPSVWTPASDLPSSEPTNVWGPGTKQHQDLFIGGVIVVGAILSVSTGVFIVYKIVR